MPPVEFRKSLSVLGSAFLALGIIPYIGWLLGIFGAALLLSGSKQLANNYLSNEIYQKMKTGITYYVIALIATAVAVLTINVMKITLDSITLVSIVSSLGIGSLTIVLIVAYAFYLKASVQLKKSLDTLAQKTGESVFGTAGLLFFWGALLTIFFIGIIMIFIAWLLTAKAFSSVKISSK